jgi:hypothetical protein
MNTHILPSEEEQTSENTEIRQTRQGYSRPVERRKGKMKIRQTPSELRALTHF